MMSTRSLVAVPLVLYSVLLAACAAPGPEPADSVFLGGPILTMDGAEPSYVEAVAVRDGRVVFAGDDTEASRYEGPETVVRDLEGRTLMPSFLDAHGHFMFALQMVSEVNVANPPVGPSTDIPSTIAAIEAFQAQAQVPEGGWIRGWGYDQEGLAEGRHITKFDLDEHFPNHAVMLVHVSQHGAVLNSLALELAGIDESTVAPEGAVINRVAGTREPEGLLMEGAFSMAAAVVPAPTVDEFLERLEPAQQMYAREGYTHMQDGYTSAAALEFLQRAARDGRLFLDLVSLPGAGDADSFLGSPDHPFGEYHGGLKLQGVKIIGDGSPQARTAFMSVPYLTGAPDGTPGWRGEPNLATEDLQALVDRVVEAGVQLFIHANGDASIDQAIEVVEGAGLTAADDARTVVIHSQFQRPDHFERYLALGMTPSYFTNHTFFWGDVHRANVGEEKAGFTSPLRSAKAAGVRFSNHHDFNVTPLSPMFMVWSAMARESRSGVVVGADERVDAYTALQALTTGPAWQVFEENDKGRIAEGLRANFVILTADPVETPVESIRDIEVVETIHDGRTVYRRD